MEHRAVCGGPTAEMVASHDTLESLPAADADHVDTIAVGEHTGHQHLIARFQRFGPAGELHFPAHARRRYSSLLVMTRNRLPNSRRFLFDQSELNGFVAIGCPGFRLHDHAWTRLDHRRGRHGAVLREDLGHADFSAEDSCNHFLLLAGPSASALPSFTLLRDLAVAGRPIPSRPAKAGTPARARSATSRLTRAAGAADCTPVAGSTNLAARP